MTRLTDKICIITGAARGIGQAVAARFKEEGARVLLTDIDDVLGAETASALGCEYRHLNVAEEADWQALREVFPAIDVLVNNAGITGFESGTGPHDPENVTLADWRAIHQVNLDGVFLGCRYAIGAMKKQASGAIINISSRSGLVGIPGAAAYASSKAAIRNHTKTVALYCAQNGWNIRCNSLHPAAIMTPMWEPMLGDGEAREAAMRAIVADTPMQRFGTPQEVAAVCAMLASDEAAYITGTEINIDGGLLAGSAASPAAAD